MAEATDIRQWARDKGHDIGERGRVPKHLQDEYEAEINQRAGINGEAVSLPDDTDTGETRPFAPSPEASQPSPPGSGGSESKPKPGKRRLPWQKAPAGAESKPPKTHKRVPLETWAARGWKVAGKILGDGRTPSSRCLYMQAPVAGVIVDDLLKGSRVDRMLQPIARFGEGSKNVGALIGLPLLVAVTERQPQLYEYMRPMMVAAAEEWVLIAGPAIRKAKARAAEIAKELAEFEFEETDDMFSSAPENPAIARMLDAIFAPMMATPAEAEPATAA